MCFVERVEDECGVVIVEFVCDVVGFFEKFVVFCDVDQDECCFIDVFVLGMMKICSFEYVYCVDFGVFDF